MSKLSDVFDAIDPKIIAKEIILPCKTAEQTYRAKHLVPNSFEDFMEDCAGYWNHLKKTYHQMNNYTIPDKYAGGVALRYVDQAYRNKGGMIWAYEKAREGMTFGIVKSGITEAFIGEAISDYTGEILNSMISPRDYDEQVAFMREYVRRFVDYEVSQGEFQMMVSNYKMILRSHVQHHADMMFERQTGIHV